MSNFQQEAIFVLSKNQWASGLLENHFCYFAQKVQYVDKHLSPHLCGYRKGYNTQTALISMLERWKLSIGNKDFAGGVLMDLGKVLDTINHQLLLA